MTALFVPLLLLSEMFIRPTVGNQGQHALISSVAPDSNLRLGMMVIDISSARYCFNDGFLTVRVRKRHEYLVLYNRSEST